MALALVPAVVAGVLVVALWRLYSTEPADPT
jgi:hypothetical protein